MAESHLDFTRPSHVVGRYALYGRLAAGGMATVHLGRSMEADGTTRTVAVKRLHPQFCKDPEFVAMFIDEARLAARIKHPNVVETLDILTMGQELLLVMEYIRGECFSKLLRAARRKNLEPSIGVVGRIASGMLHGLHAAHDATDDRGEPLNVVHRDISPQNVMIDVDGLVKVLDFGVAKASARIQITRDGQMKGKLSYMSPEQLQGMPVDRRADVFACGVVLWEALTRRRLFVGEDASEVLRKILRDEVPPPSQWVPELSPEVDQVVLRALSKDPQQRYQTAEELALDVEKIIELAPEREVGAWIDSVAGDILGKRERLLEEIERGQSEVSFGAAEASSPGHGSITDSDTFQRIQSWAEREAARAATDSHSPPVEFEDSELEPVQTVADARCIESASSSDASGAVIEPNLEGAAADDVAASSEADEPETAVTLAEEPAFARSEIGRPVSAQGPARVVDLPRRKNRNWLVALAAAAVFTGVAGVAVFGIQRSPLVKTSALLPEAPAPAPSANERLQTAGGTPVAAERQTPPTGRRAQAGLGSSEITPVSQRTEPPGVGQLKPTDEPVARTTALDTLPDPGAAQEPPPAEGVAQLVAPEAAAPVAAAPAPRPSKGRVQSAPKKVVRRAAAGRRAKPAPAAQKAPAAKVDCRQPFWIDEGGIRRLKMACL